MHNLIHLPDDVLNLNLSLSESAAFWGENYIGKMKKLIKSPYQPLAQVLNRLSELEHEEVIRIIKKKNVEKCIIDCSSTFNFEEITYFRVLSVYINENYLSDQKPNNTILLKNNHVILIDKILTTTKKLPAKSEIYILGRKMLNIHALFNYPTASSDVGIFVGNFFSESCELYSAELIKNKCILFDCDSEKCAVSLLHE